MPKVKLGEKADEGDGDEEISDVSDFQRTYERTSLQLNISKVSRRTLFVTVEFMLVAIRAMKKHILAYLAHIEACGKMHKPYIHVETRLGHERCATCIH